MFDRTFFKFALGLGVIIFFAIGTLYVTGHFDDASNTTQTATVN